MVSKNQRRSLIFLNDCCVIISLYLLFLNLLKRNYYSHHYFVVDIINVVCVILSIVVTANTADFLFDVQVAILLLYRKCCLVFVNRKNYVYFDAVG